MSHRRFHILAGRILDKLCCIYLHEKLSAVNEKRPIQLKTLTLSLRRSLSLYMISIYGRDLRQERVNTLHANLALLFSLKKQQIPRFLYGFKKVQKRKHWLEKGCWIFDERRIASLCRTNEMTILDHIRSLMVNILFTAVHAHMNC